MKITLDTNVLISATFWKGDSFKILQLINQGILTNIISQDILAEYEKVLSSEEIFKKTELKKLHPQLLVQKIISMSLCIQPKQQLALVIDDPDDNKILECAVEGHARYIITNDKHLLRLNPLQNIAILTPNEFLSRIKSSMK